MKTFTNLAHWAFKKCASFGTTNRNRYYLFTIIMLLTLGVGNAWGEEVTFNFKTIAQTSGTTGGISWETGKTGSATATGCNSTNGLVLYGVTSGGGYFQTTSPTSGVITNVNIVASPKKNKPKYTIYGSTDGNTWTAIESNITISTNNTTKDHAITGSYTYFKIANTTAATAQLAITTLTITYETSGGETPDPTPDPDPDPTPGTGGDATMTAGTNGNACTVNEKDGIKVGTSSKGGDMKVTVPAGATMLHVYAAAWNDVSGLSLNITPTSNVTTTSIALTANAGIKSNSPFTLSGDEADYLFDIPLQNITAETTLTFTSSTTKRFVVWGATYETAGSGEPEPVIVKTLQSIAVTGMTTNFEIGETFTFDGTCTATYSVTKDGFPQEDETAEVTPTSVSAPDMNTVGTQTVIVTYSEGGVEKTDDYEITITENTVTAGEYCITPNNDFWGTNFNGPLSGEALDQTYTGRQDDITIQYAKGSGSNLYINASQTRTYSGTTLTFSVPSGYLITAIAFMADGTNWKGTHTANVGSMTDSKNWAGSANEVTITFGDKCYIKNICVTYEAAPVEPVKTLTSIEITTPATQTTFWQGETFNYNGLVVTAHYSDAADEVVTPTVTGSTATAGTATVNVSYKEQSTSYDITVKAIPNTKETAYTVADAYDIIDKLTTAEGVFISGIISQVDSYNEAYKSITYWISDDGTTTKQLQAYSGKGLEGAEFVDINGVSVEDQVIVCGDLKKHTDGTYEFNYNNYLVSQIKTTKAAPELSYTTTEYNVNLGDAFTAPTLNNPHSLAVTYSSNNEDVATVAADGAVTIKAAGTVVITASFAGNEDYVAGEASYTINVTDPSISEATFVAGTDKSEELSISKNGVTVEFTGGTFSRDDNYRCYAKQSMTISYNDGQITKIVLVKSSDNSKTPSNFTTEQGTYAYAGSEGVWTGEAKSVTFETTTQVQMNTITVYYKQDTRTAAGLEWSPEAINLTIGDAFTAPTFSNPNSLNVNFDSDNTTLATVSNTGVISLNAGVTGTAVITASYEGDATYKDAAVTCTITVNPKTETVVILAQYNGQWYALKNVEETAGKVLAALPVNYVGGKLYNVEEADKATIEWQRAAVTDGIIFKNGENYISGTAGDTDLKLSTTECAWTLDGTTYKLGNRTFFYNETANGFKNYNTSNAGNSGYSNLPVVTAPVYGTGTITPMENLTPQMYGTICLENNVVGYEGITFYEVAGKEDNKVIFDEVTELVAGMPYIYIADSETATIVKGNETAAEAGYHKSLQGTFTQIDPAESNILTGNYILYNNVIKKCGKNCGLKDHKAYFIASGLEGLSAPQAQMPGRRRVSLNTTGENAATGIGDVVVPTEQATKTIINGQLIIIRDGEKFNAQGQKL